MLPKHDPPPKPTRPPPSPTDFPRMGEGIRGAMPVQRREAGRRAPQCSAGEIRLCWTDLVDEMRAAPFSVSLGRYISLTRRRSLSRAARPLLLGLPAGRLPASSRMHRVGRTMLWFRAIPSVRAPIGEGQL